MTLASGLVLGYGLALLRLGAYSQEGRKVDPDAAAEA